MEISFIRHGRSLCTENSRIDCKGVGAWIDQYDSHGVFEETEYPSAALEKIQSANIVITSDLKRAVESARLLQKETASISNPLFRETELPVPSGKLVRMKMTPDRWAVILRCLWFCGYSRDCESYREAKKRAEKAAEALIQYANTHTSVVLVGHEIFNLMIAKELQKKGWQGEKRTGSAHWSCTTYVNEGIIY